MVVEVSVESILHFPPYVRQKICSAFGFVVSILFPTDQTRKRQNNATKTNSAKPKQRDQNATASANKGTNRRYQELRVALHIILFHFKRFVRQQHGQARPGQSAVGPCCVLDCTQCSLLGHRQRRSHINKYMVVGKGMYFRLDG